MGVKKKMGFATLSLERRRELASMGGKAVPPGSRSFSRDPALAAKAGHKGGSNIPAAKRSYAVDRDLARRSGAKGGATMRARAEKARQERLDSLPVLPRGR